MHNERGNVQHFDDAQSRTTQKRVRVFRLSLVWYTNTPPSQTMATALVNGMNLKSIMPVLGPPQTEIKPTAFKDTFNYSDVFGEYNEFLGNGLASMITETRNNFAFRFCPQVEKHVDIVSWSKMVTPKAPYELTADGVMPRTVGKKIYNYSTKLRRYAGMVVHDLQVLGTPKGHVEYVIDMANHANSIKEKMEELILEAIFTVDPQERARLMITSGRVHTLGQIFSRDAQLVDVIRKDPTGRGIYLALEECKQVLKESMLTDLIFPPGTKSLISQAPGINRYYERGPEAAAVTELGAESIGLLAVDTIPIHVYRPPHAAIRVPFMEQIGTFGGRIIMDNHDLNSTTTQYSPDKRWRNVQGYSMATDKYVELRFIEDALENCGRFDAEGNLADIDAKALKDAFTQLQGEIRLTMPGRNVPLDMFLHTNGNMVQDWRDIHEKYLTKEAIEAWASSYLLHLQKRNRMAEMTTPTNGSAFQFAANPKLDQFGLPDLNDATSLSAGVPVGFNNPLGMFAIANLPSNSAAAQAIGTETYNAAKKSVQYYQSHFDAIHELSNGRFHNDALVEKHIPSANPDYVTPAQRSAAFAMEYFHTGDPVIHLKASEDDAAFVEFTGAVNAVPDGEDADAVRVLQDSLREANTSTARINATFASNESFAQFATAYSGSNLGSAYRRHVGGQARNDTSFSVFATHHLLSLANEPQSLGATLDRTIAAVEDNVPVTKTEIQATLANWATVTTPTSTNLAGYVQTGMTAHPAQAHNSGLNNAHFYDKHSDSYFSAREAAVASRAGQKRSAQGFARSADYMFTAPAVAPTNPDDRTKQLPSDLQSTAEILLDMPITKQSILQMHLAGLHVPIAFTGDRPFRTYRTRSITAISNGEPIGLTPWANLTVSVGVDNASRKMTTHISFHTEPIIIHPERVYTLNHALISDYVFGEDFTPITDAKELNNVDESTGSIMWNMEPVGSLIGPTGAPAIVDIRGGFSRHLLNERASPVLMNKLSKGPLTPNAAFLVYRFQLHMQQAHTGDDMFSVAPGTINTICRQELQLCYSRASGEFQRRIVSADVFGDKVRDGHGKYRTTLMAGFYPDTDWANFVTV